MNVDEQPDNLIGQELFGVFQSEGLCWQVDTGVTELSCPIGQLDSGVSGGIEGEAMDRGWTIRGEDAGEEGRASKDHRWEESGRVTEGDRPILSDMLRTELERRACPLDPLFLCVTGFTDSDLAAYRDYCALSFPSPSTYICTETDALGEVGYDQRGIPYVAIEENGEKRQCIEEEGSDGNVESGYDSGDADRLWEARFSLTSAQEAAQDRALLSQGFIFGPLRHGGSFGRVFIDH